VHSAITTIALVLAGCLCAISAFVIGLPVWAAAAAFLVPTGIYFIVRPRKR